MNKILSFGALLGLLSVIMAALSDHYLPQILSPKLLHSVVVAIRYHQLYAIVITALGLIISLQVNSRIKTWLKYAAYFFIAGILLFSFGIYLAIFTATPPLMHLAPLGGVTLMLGWIILLRTAWLNAQ